MRETAHCYECNNPRLAPIEVDYPRSMACREVHEFLNKLDPIDIIEAIGTHQQSARMNRDPEGSCQHKTSKQV